MAIQDGEPGNENQSASDLESNIKPNGTTNRRDFLQKSAKATGFLAIGSVLNGPIADFVSEKVFHDSRITVADTIANVEKNNILGLNYESYKLLQKLRVLSPSISRLVEEGMRNGMFFTSIRGFTVVDMHKLFGDFGPDDGPVLHQLIKTSYTKPINEENGHEDPKDEAAHLELVKDLTQGLFIGASNGVGEQTNDPTHSKLRSPIGAKVLTQVPSLLSRYLRYPSKTVINSSDPIGRHDQLQGLRELRSNGNSPVLLVALGDNSMFYDHNENLQNETHDVLLAKGEYTFGYGDKIDLIKLLRLLNLNRNSSINPSANTKLENFVKTLGVSLTERVSNIKADQACIVKVGIPSNEVISGHVDTDANPSAPDLKFIDPIMQEFLSGKDVVYNAENGTIAFVLLEGQSLPFSTSDLRPVQIFGTSLAMREKYKLL